MRWLWVWVFVVVALRAGRAVAQPAVLPQGDARPWAEGIPEAEQAVASGLYAAGNAEFTEARFAQALAKYREAIRHWDHPAIRFNMAVCLINLGALAEARDNIERALAYQAGPLGAAAYAQALTDRKLLDGQLAHIKTACNEPGAVVTLDGKYLFTAPGASEQYLMPGQHEIAATKPGFRTAFMTFSAVASQVVTYDLRPSSETGARRWRYWNYVVEGGGALIAGGALAYLSAHSDLTDYDAKAAVRCPHGCTKAQVHGYPDLRADKDHAATKQVVAFSLFSVGGAAVAIGVLGLIFDQPHVRTEMVRATPVVALAPGGAVGALRWQF